MSKKICLFFTVLFLTIFCFIGCSDLINIKTHTDIKFDLDLSKIIKSTRNNEELLEDDSTKLTQEFELKVSLYNANNFNVETQDVKNLLLITENRLKINDGIAYIRFENVTVGMNVIILVDLYEVSYSDDELTENLDLIYSGSSSVFSVKQDFNKVNIVLKKVQNDEEIGDDEIPNEDSSEDNNQSNKPDEEGDSVVEPEVPIILNQPENVLKVFATEAESNGIKNAQLSCSAFVTDGGTLSFDWYYVDEDENLWISEDDTETTNNIGKTSTITVNSNLGETKRFYCVVTNTIGDKFVTVQSNLITVAFVVGKFDSFSAKYIGEYEFYGLDSNKILENIEITEYYKDEYDNIATLTYKNPSVEKYDCKISAGFESYIGYVPFIITELSLNKTKEITIPVKYQLDVDNLDLEFWYNKDDNQNSIKFTESPTASNYTIEVPQYFTTFYCIYNDESIPTHIKDTKSEKADGVYSALNINDYAKFSVLSKDDNVSLKNGAVLDDVGQFTYQVKISSNSGSDGWIISDSDSKEIILRILPWQINFTAEDGTSVSINNIEIGKSYILNVSNTVWPSSVAKPQILLSGDGVSSEANNSSYLFTLSDSGSSVISASIPDSETIIAITEIHIVNVSVYVEVDGLTYALVNNKDTLYIYNENGLSIFRDIVNGTLSENISVLANTAGNSNKSFIKNSSVSDINAVLESNLTISDNWIPIGMYSNIASNAKPYSGTFNGNGKTITFDNLTYDSDIYSSGLFQSLSGTVHNLVIDGSINRSETGYIGSIAGYLDGGSIEYCVNNANVQNGSSAGTGGIVGYVSTGGSIIGCVNMNSVSSDSFTMVGGIVGSTSGTAQLSLTKCINLGKISGSSMVSGILGNSTSSNVILSNSINLGEISATNQSSGYSSGITTPSENYTISTSINIGEIIGYQSGAISSTSKGTYSKNYYDETINTNVVDSSRDGINGKSTTELCSLTSSDLSSEWLFFENGACYPLPNIVDNLPVGNDVTPVWEQIVYMAQRLINDGIFVSLPTYPDIEGLSNPEIDGSFVTFTVENIYESYEWYVDDLLQDSSDYIFTLDTDNMLGGIYSIMLIVTDVDGNHFSAEYQLEIRK